MNKQITLTKTQQTALDQLQDFVTGDGHRVFILKGYAGTGKTTLLHFFVEWLMKERYQYQLLASTGQAARC